MANVVEMRQKRAAIVNEARNLIDAIEKENRDWSQEEEQKYQRMMSDVDTLKEKIDKEERLSGLENELNAPASAVATSATQESPELKYRNAFDNWMKRGRGGINVAEIRALEIGDNPEGGYFVPTEYERQIIEGAKKLNIMRRLCKTMNVRNDSQIPVLSSHGSASWKVEEAAYAESDPTLSAITFSAYKLTGLVKISEELMRDSMFDMGSFISDELARQFADAEETAFLTGNGSGKPTGLLQTAEIGKTTSSSTAFTGDELIDVYHALDKKYRNNSVWLAHDLVVAKLRKLKMSSDSTGGDKQYLWQPGLQAGQPDRVLGRPIYTAEDMDDTMTSGDSTFVLFDPSMYWIVDRGATYMQRLNELYAANGQIGFRGFRRMDGHLVFAEAAQKLVQS